MKAINLALLLLFFNKVPVAISIQRKKLVGRNLKSNNRNFIQVDATNHATMPVEVLHTHHPAQGDYGKYFYFDKHGWSDQIGLHENAYVAQVRGSAYIWTGKVTIWDNEYGTFGSRSEGATDSQWQTGDKIIKAVRVTDINRINRIGRYFFFDSDLFLSQFDCSGEPEKCIIVARQWRNGNNTWTGSIRSFGSSGRRNPLNQAKGGDWKVGDIITTHVAPTDAPTDSPTDAPTDSPTDAPTDSEQEEEEEEQLCAIENEKALACRSNKGKEVCCPGLVCHRYQYWRCVNEENVHCSGPNTLAQECGAWKTASPFCCPGLVCDGNFCVPPTDE